MRIPFEDLTLEAVQGKALRAILHVPDEDVDRNFDHDLAVHELVETADVKVIRCGVKIDTVTKTSKKEKNSGGNPLTREETLNRAQVEFGIARGGWIEVDDA